MTGFITTNTMTTVTKALSLAALLGAGTALPLPNNEQNGCYDIMCTIQYQPVCGSDGRTHGNRCSLGRADCFSREAGGPSVEILYPGECRPFSSEQPRHLSASAPPPGAESEEAMKRSSSNCATACQFAGWRTGEVKGTAPFCAASANSCRNKDAVMTNWDAGAGCWSGQKVCCCNN